MYYFNTRELEWLEEDNGLVTFDPCYLLFTKDPPDLLHQMFLAILNAPIEEVVRIKFGSSGEALGCLYRLVVMANPNLSHKDLEFGSFSQRRDFLRGFDFVGYYRRHNRFYSFIVEGFHRCFFIEKLKLRPIEQNSM